jgi:hypothetical protein
MAIVEAISIPVNLPGQENVAKAANDFENLSDAVKKTEQEAKKLANTYGINDERTREAIKEAGNYRKQMTDLQTAIGNSSQNIGNLTKATQGVVAGMQVAIGVTALFGTKNEDLEKTLVKLEGAMALSQGIKDFKEFGGDLKNLGSLIQGNLVKAFKSFSVAARSALAATGIGLLVVAVGTLLAYWDEIIGAVNGVSGEQEKLLETQQKSASTAQEQLDSISEQENILKQQGKTEEDILNLKIAATKTTITALEAQLLTQKEVKKSQIEASQRNKAILQGIIQFISLPLTGLLMTVDAVGKALGQDFGLNEKFAGGLASLVFDPEEVAEEADKTIAETEANLGKLRNSLAGHENAVKGIRTKSAADNKAEADKRAEDERLANEKFAQDYIDSQVEILDSEQELIDKAYAAKVKAEEDYQAFLQKSAEDKAKFIDEQYAKQQLALVKSITDEKALQEASDQLEIERLNNQIMAATDAGNSTVALELELAAKKKVIADKEVDEDKERKKAVADLEQQIFDNSQALAAAIISVAGQNSKAGKAIALASIAADTAMALSKALSNANSTASADNLVTGGLAAIPKYIALATTILSNSKRAYDIIKAPAPSISPAGGGGGESRAAAAVPRFNAPGVRFGTNEEFTQVRRIYVTERDITNVQDKVRVTEGLSQF